MQGHPAGERRRGETLWSCHLPSTSAKPRDPMAVSYHGRGLRQLLPANDCQPAAGCVSLLFCWSRNPWSWDSLEPGREARHAVLEDVLRHSPSSSSQACPAETGECILHPQEKSVLLIRVPTYVTASESDSFREHIKREAGSPWNKGAGTREIAWGAGRGCLRRRGEPRGQAEHGSNEHQGKRNTLGTRFSKGPAPMPRDYKVGDSRVTGIRPIAPEPSGILQDRPTTACFSTPKSKMLWKHFGVTNPDLNWQKAVCNLGSSLLMWIKIVLL